MKPGYWSDKVWQEEMTSLGLKKDRAGTYRVAQPAQKVLHPVQVQKDHSAVLELAAISCMQVFLFLLELSPLTF